MREDRVMDRGVGCFEDKLLEQVCYDQEEIGGDGIALTQAIFAVNPVAWDTIQKNGGFACGKDVLDPAAEGGREASGEKDFVEGRPCNRVKSFTEV